MIAAESTVSEATTVHRADASEAHGDAHGIRLGLALGFSCDVDRALQQPASSQPAPAQTVAMAQAKPAQEAQASDSLDKTSLIGKIFIACGALLTMASAARMFMA